MKKWGIIFFAFMLSGRAMASSPPAFEQLNFTTPDGVTLYASFAGKAPCARGAVLLHMLGRTRADWAGFQQQALAGGVCTLAFDLRGHGQSVKHKGKPDLDYKYFLTKDWEMVAQNDLRAALAALTKRLAKTAPPPAVMGASIGGNLAILGGTQHRVSGVAALSPGEDYKGVRPAASLNGLKTPLFLSASSEDKTSHESAIALEKAFRGQKQSLYFTGAGHGTQMLSRPELAKSLLKWLGGLKAPKLPKNS